MAQIYSEATHLSAAFFTKQIPVNNICRDIPEAQCIKHALLSYVVKDDYIANATRELVVGDSSGNDETKEETLVARTLEHMLANLEGLNTAGVTQFCAEDTLANHSVDSPAADCYCTEYSFAKDDASVSAKPRKEEDPKLDEVDPLSDSLEDLAVNASGDFVPSDVTASEIVGKNIQKHYGTVVLSGAVLWIDTPFVTQETMFYSTPKMKVAVSHQDTVAATPVNNSLTTIGADGLDPSVSQFAYAPKANSLVTTYTTKTKALISFGVASPSVVIKALYVNGALVPRARYRIMDSMSFAANGDLNALRYMPAYKDLTVVALEDINVNGTLDVKAVVAFSPTPSPTMPVAEGLVPLASPSSRIQFDAKSLTYVDTATNTLKAVSLQVPFGAAPSAFDVPLPTGMDPVGPHWQRASNGDIAFFNGTTGTIDTYTPESALTTVQIFNVTQPPLIFAYANRTVVTNDPLKDELIIKVAGKGTTRIPFPPGTVFDKAVTVDETVVDIFVNGYKELWRIELAAAVSLTMFPLRKHPNVLNVAHTSKYYVIFADDGANVYTAASLTFVGQLSVPSTLGTVLNTDRYSEQPYSLSLVIGMSVYTLDFTDFTVITTSLPINALASPKVQMYDNGRLVCVCSDNIVRMLSTDVLASASPPTSPGEVLTALGYATPDHFDKVMTGFTVTDDAAAIRDLTNVYAFPRGGTGGAINIGSVENSRYDITRRTRTLRSSSVVLTHKSLTNVRTGADKTTTHIPEDGVVDAPTSVSLAATYTDDEARLTAAQHHDFLEASRTDLVVQTTSLLEQYGDTIQLSTGALYTIYDYEVGLEGVVTYRARATVQPERLSVPQSTYSDPLTPTSVNNISWDFSGTRLHHIPIALGGTADSALVFMGETPSKICINNDCQTAVPAQPCTLFGHLTSPMPFYQSDTRTIDSLSDIHILFGFDISANLVSATYDELVADPYKNLVIVGYEAFQFQSFTVLGDNRTVVFSELLRGRFNTQFFVNFHRAGESCFIYTPETFTLFATAQNTFSLAVDTPGQNNVVVRNDTHGYRGTVDVAHIGYRTGTPNRLLVQLASSGANAQIVLSVSPIIWGQVSKSVFYMTSLDTDIVNTVGIPYVPGKRLYWMITADAMFPAYGLIDLPTSRRKLRTHAKKTYTLLGPRNTLTVPKTNTYVPVVL